MSLSLPIGSYKKNQYLGKDVGNIYQVASSGEQHFRTPVLSYYCSRGCKLEKKTRWFSTGKGGGQNTQKTNGSEYQSKPSDFPDAGDVDHQRKSIIVCFDLNSKQDKAPRWNPVQVLGKPSKGWISKAASGWGMGSTQAQWRGQMGLLSWLVILCLILPSDSTSQWSSHSYWKRVSPHKLPFSNPLPSVAA